jgi:hypothetical protein
MRRRRTARKSVRRKPVLGAQKGRTKRKPKSTTRTGQRKKDPPLAAIPHGTQLALFKPPKPHRGPDEPTNEKRNVGFWRRGEDDGTDTLCSTHRTERTPHPSILGYWVDLQTIDDLRTPRELKKLRAARAEKEKAKK